MSIHVAMYRFCRNLIFVVKHNIYNEIYRMYSLKITYFDRISQPLLKLEIYLQKKYQSSILEIHFFSIS